MKRDCNSVTPTAYDLAAQDTTALHGKVPKTAIRKEPRTTPRFVRITAFPLVVIPALQSLE